MKIIATTKSEQNRMPVDPWTAVHIGAGLAFGLMNVPRAWAAGAAIGYEVAEQVFERYEWGKTLFATSGPEVISNAVVDTVVFMAAHRLGELWNATE